MEEFLKEKLRSSYDIYEDEEEGYGAFWKYSEDVNEDALTNAWLDNRTSFIYKVGVLCAIDSNKCDFAYIAIGVQRKDFYEPELKGIFCFDEGENDDIARVLKRAMNLLPDMHCVFEDLI